mgnify:CR=1 FL=1
MKKTAFKIGVGFLIALFLTDVVASFYFYNLVIKRNVKDFLVGNKDLEVSAAAMDVFLEGDWRQWVRNQPFDNWEIESFDGLKLQGYYLEAKEPTNKTVMFAHGYLGNAKVLVCMASTIMMSVDSIFLRRICADTGRGKVTIMALAGMTAWTICIGLISC